MIRQYCKDLKRKRYARTYHRFKTIRARKLSLRDEAMDLCEQEHFDKGLTRAFYYDRDEPSEMVSTFYGFFYFDSRLVCNYAFI